MSPSYREMLHVFGRIGLYSFGGPAAQIAVMHKELVDERPWLTESQFLNALSFCMLLPGPEAMQLTTYAGWRLKGVAGGLLAGLFFVLPGAAVILALGAIYVTLGNVPVVEAIFLGVKAVVVVIVIEALHKVARRALKGPEAWLIAGLAFVAIFLFALPFPAIVTAAALWGVLRLKRRDATETDRTASPSVASTLGTAALWASIWLTPVLLLWLSGARFLTEVALFFSKLAVVTFGGAYAVLAYMTQEVVVDKAWMTTEGMMDGLGLAETTPGPLILVTEFVGFIAGFGEGGWAMGVAAAVVTLWVTFVPCFLWIFAGAPWIETLRHMPRLGGALDGITAAVVGVILNLSLWFAAHVFFETVKRVSLPPIRTVLPVWSTLDPVALGLAGLAAVMMFGLHQGLGRTLLAGAVLGVVTLLF